MIVHLFCLRGACLCCRYVCDTFDLMRIIFPLASLRLDHLCDVMSSHRITTNILRRELWKMSPSATNLLAALWTQKNAQASGLRTTLRVEAPELLIQHL